MFKIFFMMLAILTQAEAVYPQQFTYGKYSESLDPDTAISQDIYQRVIQDGSLSQAAKLINIVSSKGVVTLTGDVLTYIEKKSLESKAKEVSGVKKVVNQLRIKRMGS